MRIGILDQECLMHEGHLELQLLKKKKKRFCILKSYNDLIQAYCRFIPPEGKQYFIFWFHFIFFDNWESTGLRIPHMREELHHLLE